jgi:hypothetical protein
MKLPEIALNTFEKASLHSALGVLFLPFDGFS